MNIHTAREPHDTRISVRGALLLLMRFDFARLKQVLVVSECFALCDTDLAIDQYAKVAALAAALAEAQKPIILSAPLGRVLACHRELPQDHARMCSILGVQFVNEDESRIQELQDPYSWTRCAMEENFGPLSATLWPHKLAEAEG